MCFSNKATVADFVEAEDGFVLSEFFGGQAYHTAVVCIGRDPDQPNGRLCLSLDEDIGRLAAMSDVELQSRLSEKPSPIRRLRINAAPTLTALFDAPTHMLSSGSIDDVESRARWVKDDTNLRDRLISAYVASRTAWQASSWATAQAALTYEQALAETDKLLKEMIDADGLLAQYRLYLQEGSARAAAFRARLVV